MNRLVGQRVDVDGVVRAVDRVLWHDAEVAAAVWQEGEVGTGADEDDDEGRVDGGDDVAVHRSHQDLAVLLDLDDLLPGVRLVTLALLFSFQKRQNVMVLGIDRSWQFAVDEFGIIRAPSNDVNDRNSCRDRHENCVGRTQPGSDNDDGVGRARELSPLDHPLVVPVRVHHVGQRLPGDAQLVRNVVRPRCQDDVVGNVAEVFAVRLVRVGRAVPEVVGSIAAHLPQEAVALFEVDAARLHLPALAVRVRLHLEHLPDRRHRVEVAEVRRQTLLLDKLVVVVLDVGHRGSR